VRTPLVVLTGVDPLALDQALLGVAWDLPHAVAVRHRIDPESQLLHGTVSDASGIVEETSIELEHACPTCALREDVVPTLERLAGAGRWGAVVACLPTGVEAHQLATIVSRDPRLARWYRLAAVVTAISASTEDLLGDDRLEDRGWQAGPYDERGVGEVACALVEHADVVLLSDAPEPAAADLVRALARPDAEVHHGTALLSGARLVESRHGYAEASAWSSPVRRAAAPPVPSGDVWQLDLRSDRPFHPERLVDEISALAGEHRSRGCFWVPTRAGVIGEWGGAGGHLSIGSYGAWNRSEPVTRLLLTGLGAEPAGLGAAFGSLLATPAELASRPRWRVLEDGLEPWLGDIREVA
jgi:G3E family GTPase